MAPLIMTPDKCPDLGTYLQYDLLLRFSGTKLTKIARNCY